MPGEEEKSRCRGRRRRRRAESGGEKGESCTPTKVNVQHSSIGSFHNDLLVGTNGFVNVIDCITHHWTNTVGILLHVCTHTGVKESKGQQEGEREVWRAGPDIA